jgi:hypothetical protein
MDSPGAKRLPKEVERVTGYRVVVDTIDGISEDAQMISARPEFPVHSIRVNKARLPFADYIVAIQCAMLLRLWSDPAHIPVFSPVEDKVRYAVDRATKARGLSKLPVGDANQTASRMVHGLLDQLRSMPLEILTQRDCYEACPDLRELQADSVNENLRRLSENLSPEIRSFAPETTWKNKMSMTAALALNWTQLSGSSLPMLPYQSAGFAGIAQTLLDDVIARLARTSSSYTGLVDAWAAKLGLRNLYQWEYRNGQQ